MVWFGSVLGLIWVWFGSGLGLVWVWFGLVWVWFGLVMECNICVVVNRPEILHFKVDDWK